MKRPDVTVRLGYTVGSGEPVDIPVRHMVVTGQTQEAGKTTALEGLIARSGLRAVTFVTKRGESGFAGARRIPPYFREQADWQFVASILEASRGEKLKMERSFIIRASKGATTLATVHANVKRFMADPKVRGLAADMYLCLDAYLEVVVPTIGRTRWAPSLDLQPGVNAVDLTGVPAEMQHLVIQSSLSWVLEREQDTIAVIPEAWKFMPQGRNTPVKLAADALIRQGAGLGNYVWLDSQDIGGIEKATLRHCPVWLLGVQRESNEIARTLANIPDSVAKPKRADVATLELGQFYACWGRHAVKTYAQPAWLDDISAKLIASEALTLAECMRLYDELWPNRDKQEDPTVTNEEADRLTHENTELKDTIKGLMTQIEQMQLDLMKLRNRPADPKPGVMPRSPVPVEKKSSAVISHLPPASARTFSVEETADNERFYQAIKARLLAEAPSDQQLLKVLTTRPEMVVQVQRREVSLDGSSTRGRVARLMAGGWFSEARTVSETRQELKRTGADPGGGGTLYDICNNYVRDGFFVREGDAFVLSPAAKVREEVVSTT